MQMRVGSLARLLDEQIPKGALVLEAGCGTGQLTNVLRMSWKRRISSNELVPPCFQESVIRFSYLQPSVASHRRPRARFSQFGPAYQTRWPHHYRLVQQNRTIDHRLATLLAEQVR
jgi:sugar (pentulose or hexulose) kinase